MLYCVCKNERGGVIMMSSVLGFLCVAFVSVVLIAIMVGIARIVLFYTTHIHEDENEV